MKVENAHNNSIVPKQTENANPVEKNPRSLENERIEKLNAKDQASLSERAKLLATARIQMAEIPDIRTEKVNELRDQLKAGSYQISYEKLADLLISRFALD